MTGSGYGTIRGGEPEPEQVTIYYLQGVSINYKLGLRAIKMHQIFALRPNLLVTVYRNTLYKYPDMLGTVQQLRNPFLGHFSLFTPHFLLHNFWMTIGCFSKIM